MAIEVGKVSATLKSIGERLLAVASDPGSQDVDQLEVSDTKSHSTVRITVNTPYGWISVTDVERKPLKTQGGT